MLNKEERTIAVYMKAGALMRLYKTIGAKLFDAVGAVISAADRKKLLCALHGISYGTLYAPFQAVCLLPLRECLSTPKILQYRQG